MLYKNNKYEIDLNVYDHMKLIQVNDILTLMYDFDKISGLPRTKYKVVSIIGSVKSGKSSLLNMIISKLNNEKMYVFPSDSTTSKKCTTGVDMYIHNNIIFLDFEGMHQTNSIHDPELLLLAYLISDLIILNDKECNNAMLKSLEPLTFFLHYLDAKKIRLDSKPDLCIRIRDYSLDVDVSEILRETMTKCNDQYDIIRETLKLSFNSIDVVSTSGSSFDWKLMKLNEYISILGNMENGFKRCVDKVLQKINSHSGKLPNEFASNLLESITSINENLKINPMKLDVTKHHFELEIYEFMERSIDDSLRTPIVIDNEINGYQIAFDTLVMGRIKEIEKVLSNFDQQFSNVYKEIYDEGRENIFKECNLHVINATNEIVQNANKKCQLQKEFLIRNLWIPYLLGLHNKYFTYESFDGRKLLVNDINDQELSKSTNDNLVSIQFVENQEIENLITINITDTKCIVDFSDLIQQMMSKFDYGTNRWYHEVVRKNRAELNSYMNACCNEISNIFDENMLRLRELQIFVSKMMDDINNVEYMNEFVLKNIERPNESINTVLYQSFKMMLKSKIEKILESIKMNKIDNVNLNVCSSRTLGDEHLIRCSLIDLKSSYYVIAKMLNIHDGCIEIFGTKIFSIMLRNNDNILDIEFNDFEIDQFFKTSEIQTFYRTEKTKIINEYMKTLSFNSDLNEKMDEVVKANPFLDFYVVDDITNEKKLISEKLYARVMLLYDKLFPGGINWIMKNELIENYNFKKYNLEQFLCYFTTQDKVMCNKYHFYFNIAYDDIEKKTIFKSLIVELAEQNITKMTDSVRERLLSSSF